VIEGRIEGKVTRQLLREKKTARFENGRRKVSEEGFIWQQGNKNINLNKKYDVSPSLSSRLIVIKLPTNSTRERKS